MIRLFILIMTLFAATSASAQVAGEGATDIVRYYGARAAHIQSVGVRFNDNIDLAAQGSGLLLDDRYILTNDHVVPDVAHNYRSLTINIRLVSRRNDPVTGKVVARDAANDLALVELDVPKEPSPYCPVSALMPPARMSAGNLIYMIGYPLDRDRSVGFGILAADDADGALLQTTAPLVPGYSGSPIFSSKGYLVAVAVRAPTVYTFPDGRQIPVQGISDLVPISRLLSSPVGQYVKNHSTSSCWREITTMPTADQFGWTVNSATNGTWFDLAAASSNDGPSIAAAIPPDDKSIPPIPDTVSVEYALSQTKDDHELQQTSQQYSRSFDAQAGYLIDNCELALTSANNESGVRCVVDADRRTARVVFELSSGPIYDQWRGWLLATVALTQKREDLIKNAALLDQKVIRSKLSYQQREHGLSTTTKTYRHPITAENGFIIEECSFESLSTNKAHKIGCEISPDGKSAIFTFALKSGPLFDRWRGWLNGSLVTRLVKIP